LFAFAAIHYAVQWSLSRSERVLLVFSIQCAMYTVFSVAIVAFFRARTVADAQTALGRFVTIGVLTHAVILQLYARLGERRDRAFRALVTGALVFLAVLNQWAPLRGTVLELRTMRLPGGATTFLPIRTPPGASLVGLYLVVLVVQAYGLVATGAIWKRDRVGAVLVGAASTAIVAGAALGFLVDFAHVRAPYAGAWPHAVFALSVAFFLSREYSARGARLVVSERSAARSLRDTQEALGKFQEEQRRREEAEAARQRALEAVVQAQRNELASQIAAGVAHDFNNVLNVISLWSSALLNPSLPALDPEKARQALADARNQGMALSKQLMTLARPEARRLTRFPLDRPVHATVQTLRPALPPGIQLDCQAPAAPEVEADETEIRQVIYNLVLNARDAMPDGGLIQVAAGFETSLIPIDVVGGSLAAGRWATLAVTDSGPGIDAAIRERIFDLFFTTKGPERGTGLGLATVMRIAKTSGGGVALDAGAGRGASFKVYLPAA